jgi:hypothetical protein
MTRTHLIAASLTAMSLATLTLASPAIAQTKPATVAQTNQAAIRGPGDASLVGALQRSNRANPCSLSRRATPRAGSWAMLAPAQAQVRRRMCW